MDYAQLFVQGWRFTWHHKRFWVFGSMAALGSAILQVTWRILLNSQPSGSPQRWFDWLSTTTSAQFLFFSLAAIFVFLLLLFWLFAIVAEGGLISAVAVYRRGEQVSLRDAWHSGWGLLVRFIAIDSIIFAPLFVVMLLLIIVAVGFLLGSVFAVYEGVELQEMLVASTLGTLLCLLPLVCLIIPLWTVTYAVRLFAFRSIALSPCGVRDSIRNGVQLIRRNIGSLIIVAALLWLTTSLADITANLLLFSLEIILPFPTINVETVSAMQLNSIGLHWLAPLIIVLLTLVPGAIGYTFSTSVWTLMYHELSAGEVAADSLR